MTRALQKKTKKKITVGFDSDCKLDGQVKPVLEDDI